MTRPVLYFVRHGETEWNAQGRLQGQRDTPLNARGVAQAAEAGRRLAYLVGDARADLAYLASPLERTRRTMEGLRTALGLDPAAYATDPRLVEIGFGDWEGLTWADLRRDDPGRMSERDGDRWHHRPPGEGGESYEMVLARLQPVLDGLTGPTVMVAHGGVARAVMVGLGLASREEAPRLEILQGRVLVLDGGRRWA